MSSFIVSDVVCSNGCFVSISAPRWLEHFYCFSSTVAVVGALLHVENTQRNFYFLFANAWLGGNDSWCLLNAFC